MNQNLTYTTYTTDPRTPQGQQGMSFHPSSYQSSTYTTSSTAPFHSSSSTAFIPNNTITLGHGVGCGIIERSIEEVYKLQQSPLTSRGGQVGQTQMRISTDNDEKRVSQLLDTYFIEQPAPSTSTWATPSHQTVQVQSNQGLQGVQTLQVAQLPPQISYTGGTLVTTNVKGVGVNMNLKVAPISPDKAEKERLKKARQAEAARMRYHRLTPQEKRELNLKRTLAQKRKRQREKELEELESILRETNDIQEDPDITEQLREKRMRAKWAEAARQRYARMTPEERRAHNNRRRMRQMQNALAAVKASSQAAGGTGDPIKDEEAVRAHIKAQNAKKAEAARQRYHRMTEEEKRIYNQRRTEAFRRRRMEEEMLLAMPIGRINGEALDRAQQIVVRNAKRAEAARLRYQRMTPEQRKSYNQKRYTPKRKRMDGMDSLTSSGGSLPGSCKKEEDALSAIERDVLKKTQQAQQAIMRQQRQSVQVLSQPVTTTATQQAVQGGTYIIQQGTSTPVTHIGQGQVQQIQLTPANGVTHQQVVHTVHQVPVQTVQTIPGQQGGHVTVAQQQMPSSSGHLVVQQQAPTTSGGQQLVHQQATQQQITYATGEFFTVHMNQHPIYITAGSPRESASPHSRILETLTPAEVSSFSQSSLSFHPQTTTYYSPAPTTFHASSSNLFGSDRKNEYLLVSSNIMSSSASPDLSPQGSLQSRLPELSSSLATSENGLLTTSVTLSKEHPAVAQADQMNAFIDTYFVEHEPSTSSQDMDSVHHDHDDFDHVQSIDEELDEMKKKQRAEQLRREKDRKELDDLLRDSSEGEIDLQKYREQRSKMRRAEAARSRYQRMSEAERKVYNQRRRLRALGLDPDMPKGAFIDNEAIREHIKMANAKKAEAARLRYHRMTPEEKREYNQRRTESFRRRRLEEEILLSTPAGRISAEALQKAQQIMVRNARKAEAARARYQKMSPEQRKEYNMRRAQAKKMRALTRENRNLGNSNCSIVSGDLSHPSSVSSSFDSGNNMSLLDSNDMSSAIDHISGSSQVSHTNDDIFEQMEREVIKRTKQAQMTLARQQQQTQTQQTHASRLIGNMGNVDPHIVDGDTVLITNDGHIVDDKCYIQPSQLIDEKALHEMLLTGLDANGQPVELRTVDGTLIRGEEQLRAITNGQPFLIHPQPLPITNVEETSKALTFANAQDQMDLAPSSSSMVMDSSNTLYASHEIVIDDMPDSSQSNIRFQPQPQPETLRRGLTSSMGSGEGTTRGLTVAERNEISKAKRAERARIRYHSMRPELRQQQNAKRAELLRKARQRDEELCRLAESCQLDTLDDETRRAIADAQMRRARRAEQARAKYHRMNCEERRQYNAMRDAQRRQRKRAQEEARQRAQMNEVMTTETGLSPTAGLSPVTDSISQDDHGLSPGDGEPGQIIYSTFEMYQEPMTRWEQ
ncbi:hypothetical protein OESDEN_09112 [Oesophagostomum dentatum]|uniref:Uncharacterized protein n=1 Tax=Oesophagostomum dentatum TaxID=61180 RepID=A0A0B1T6K9_OESDE|nr:hypothetical protein OESDEN_09112 [Oesophagostomum dentatum]